MRLWTISWTDLGVVRTTIRPVQGLDGLVKGWTDWSMRLDRLVQPLGALVSLRRVETPVGAIQNTQATWVALLSLLDKHDGTLINCAHQSFVKHALRSLIR